MEIKTWIFIVISILLGTIAILFFNMIQENDFYYLLNDDEVTLKQDVEGKILSYELNKDNYKKVLEYYEIKDAEIVLAQALLETGYFKSYNCVIRNNTLGLVNSKRKEYFSFNHWSESIRGYKEMVEYKKKENEDHYSFLKRIGYAEDPNYVSKLKRIITDLEDEKLIAKTTSN